MSARAKLVGILGAGAAAALVAGVSTHEGLRLATYLDGGAIPTYCFGETAHAKMGQSYTHAQCEAIRDKRILEFVEGVLACVHAEMTPWQLAAFSDFAYNVGISKFCASDMARLANAGDMAGARAQFDQWVYGRLPDGTKIDCRRPEHQRRCGGIPKRRAEEKAMFVGDMSWLEK